MGGFLLTGGATDDSFILGGSLEFNWGSLQARKSGYSGEKQEFERRYALKIY